MTTEFPLEPFSTELLVECFLNQLENAPNPSRSYTMTSSGNLQSDAARKWIRLTDTLIQCLRFDLKIYPSRASERGKHHMENNAIRPDVYNRSDLAKVISHWFPDLRQLYSFHENIPTNADLETLYAHVESLHNVAKYIWERSQRENSVKNVYVDDKKDEVVFVFDDDSSSNVSQLRD